MKPLKITYLSILTILSLACLSSQVIAQAGQESIRAFYWEGLSLSLTPDQMVKALEGDGYKQSRVTEGKKKISFYQRKTETGSNKVQIIEKNGALIKLIFSELRAGGKKNSLSPDAADNTLSSIKAKLGIDDSFCTSGIKGGGKCTGRPGSATHNNSYSVSVNPRAIKITLASNPKAQAIIEHNKVVADGLASAYACFGTTDITSVKEVYDCIQSSSRILIKMSRSTGHHNVVNLQSPATRCSHLTNFYKRGLAYESSDSEPISGSGGGATPQGSSAGNNDVDISLIPDCNMFAAVIKRAIGGAPYWSNCINPTDDGDSIKACIAGYTPSLVNGIRFYLPSCEKLQKSYKVSAISGQPKSKGYNPSVPSCERLASLAKEWRPELPEDLKPCEGYDPEKTAEHVNACLAPERITISLKTCADVRAKYRQYVNMANGSIPDDFYALPCDQAEPLLARAEALREKRRKEAEELARRMAEREKLVQQERKEHIQNIKDKMAQKYADTPENIASRTSVLEKQIKSTGKIPNNCDGYYCPPTLEEIRLAMMRYQSNKIGLKIVTGHLMHGKKPTAATIFMMMGGQQGKGMIGMELYYKEAKLIYNCKLEADSYDCYFKLPFNTQYDELTSIYMDGLTSGLPFNLNDMIFNMLGNAMAVEEYSFLFRIDTDGLWRASPTMQQKMKDIEKKVDAMDTGHHH